MSDESREGVEERRERTEEIRLICCILGMTALIFRQLIISVFGCFT